MGHSTIYNHAFLGDPSNVSYSGTQFFEFTPSTQPGQTTGKTILTDGSTLNMFFGAPSPDPWTMMYSNVQSNFFDLTLDIAQYQLYDYAPRLSMYFRIQRTLPGDAFPPPIGYNINVNAPEQTIVWGDGFSTRKSISYAAPSSGIFRFLLDEHLLSIYINGTFIDSYDYSVGYVHPIAIGHYGIFNYGPMTNKYNRITLRTDRLDNITF